MLVPAQQHGTILNLAKDPDGAPFKPNSFSHCLESSSEPRQRVKEASLESSCSDGQAASRRLA